MSARSFGAVAGTLVGRRKQRGDADFPTDPVRAHSWDVDSAKAQPGRPIGDGSREFGWAFTDAMRHVARKLFEEHRDQDYDGPQRMQRSFLDVLDALFRFLDYRTGDLFVPYDRIAEKARTCPNTAKSAIACFEYWGLLNHVRRSQRVEAAEGEAGPRRKQAPNGYYFDCRRQMTSGLWKRFWGRIIYNLKRVSATVARRAGAFTQTFNEKAKQAPRATGELGAMLARIERDHFAAAPPEPGASAKKVRYPELQA